jgi:hypothetical protein
MGLDDGPGLFLPRFVLLIRCARPTGHPIQHIGFLKAKPKGSKFKFMEVRDLKGKVEKRIG